MSESDEYEPNPISLARVIPGDWPASPGYGRAMAQRRRALRPLRIPSVPAAGSAALTCPTCAKFERHGWGIRMDELMGTAEIRGCTTCQLLMHALLKTVDWLESYGWPSYTLQIFGQGPLVELKGIVFGNVIKETTILLYTKNDERPSEWPRIAVYRQLGSRTSTYPSIVSGWLRDCQENHRHCFQDEQSLPFRVLEVGNATSNLVRLRVFQGQKEKGRYAALSHCWGGPLEMKTTKDKYDAYQQGILFSNLPQTFQDAVEVTRAIGLQFLWIDALCIIQDSTEDWEIESSKMASIYRDAWVVIGATVSSSTASGFLQSHKINRKIQKRQEYYGRSGPGFEIAKIESEGTTVFARVHHRHNDFATLLSKKNREDDGGRRMPLSQRTWTFQEQCLATRMVHFTDLELIWECRSDVRCECLEMEQFCWQPSRFQLELCLYTRDKQALYNMWQVIVREALGRNITQESDILPALAGIAVLFQRHGAGEYLAGLWRDEMPHALLWGSRLGGRNPGPPDSWRGPSWSWVSTRGEYGRSWVDWGNITPAMTKVKTFCRVLEASTTPKGLNPLGEVSSGHLTLSAPMLEVRWDGAATKAPWDTRFVPVPDMIVPDDLPKMYTSWDDIWDEGSPAAVYERYQWLTERNLHLLFIRGDARYGKKSPPHDLGSEGLVLRKRPDVSDTTFERVGCFWTLFIKRDEGDELGFGSKRKLKFSFERVIKLCSLTFRSSKDWVHFAKMETVEVI